MSKVTMLRNNERHVQRVTGAGTLRGQVHAVAASGVTWCHWVYVTDKTSNGNTVYMAADVKDDVTCQKCKNLMILALEKHLRKNDPQLAEDVLTFAVNQGGEL